MKRVIVVHRWSGGPDDDWRPWLKKELERRGFEVLVPEMPDRDVPIIEKWVGKLSEVVGIPDKDTYFIGHSIGCQTILRYLDSHLFGPLEAVGGALFVAGWFNLENLEDEETARIAKPWIEIPIDLVKIKAVLPKSILIISDNDPYGAFKENTDKFAQIMTHAVVLPYTGHITGSEEPAILDQLMSLVK